jgi:O-antigen/teichoic acid export membrane protein
MSTTNLYLSIRATANNWKTRIFFHERDALFLLLSRFVQIGNSFVTSVVLIKKFGIDSVGTYTIASVAVTILSLVCSLGLNYSLPQAVLSNRQRATIASALSLLALPGIAIFIWLYSFIVSLSPVEMWEIALFSSVGYFIALMVVLNTLLLLDGRTHLSIIPPLINSTSLLAAVALADSVSEFGIVILTGWAVGSICILFLLGPTQVDYKTIVLHGKQGLKYLPPDLISLFSEQSVILVVAHFLARSELGIYGLCRQVVTLADTPGWSFVQSKYPSLVGAELSRVKEIEHANKNISILMSICSFVASCVLGSFVYRVHHFWMMMMVLCLCIPYRYVNNLYDQVMKAMGRAGLCTSLALAKLVMTLCICTPLVMYLHLWGAVFSLAIISLVAGYLYRRKVTAIIYGIR